MKAIISLSGGMDSATVLAEALDQMRSVQAVGFCYGSKHNQFENEAAKALCSHYGLDEFRLLDLSFVMGSFRSSLMITGSDVPEGHYEADSMRQTVVPGRNSIFASILLGIAQSEGAQEVWLGIHAGDHFIYPDCRPEWLEAVNSLYRTASEGEVKVVAPFLTMDKRGILQRGYELGVPYQKTRTCYKNQRVACGRCGSCQERLQAWSSLGKSDPIEYETRELISKE